MVLLALVVGAVTAWYLGVRAGVIAAASSAIALVAAIFVPRVALPVYVLIGLWLAGLWFFKTKLAALVQPAPQRSGWERELDRWKRRATWLLRRK